MSLAYDHFSWDGAFASDWRWPTAGVLIYLAVVFLLGVAMKDFWVSVFRMVFWFEADLALNKISSNIRFSVLPIQTWGSNPTGCVFDIFVILDSWPPISWMNSRVHFQQSQSHLESSKTRKRLNTS